MAVRTDHLIIQRKEIRLFYLREQRMPLYAGSELVGRDKALPFPATMNTAYPELVEGQRFAYAGLLTISSACYRQRHLTGC